MSVADRERLETRVVVVAPTVKDAQLTGALLAQAGITCVRCLDQAQACEELTAGAGAVLIADEAVQAAEGGLAEWLGRQPSWSDLPVLVLARTGADSVAVARAVEELGNVTILERPVRVAALVSVVRTALRARQRQYQLRDQLVQRERVAEHLTMAMAAANAGSWQVNLMTGEFRASDRAIELHGLPPGTHLNHEQALACVHPEDRASLEAALRLTFETGKSFWHEHRVPQPDGSIRWVVSHAERRDEGGQACVIGLVQDVTARKRAEETLRTSDDRFRLAADAVNGIIYEWDILTGHVERQRGLYQVVGYRAAEVPPTAAWWRERIHPDDLKALEQQFGESAGNSVLGEYRVRHRDGRWLHVEDRAVLVRGEDGRPVKRVGCTVDVTARKRAETEQQEAQRQVAQTLETITDGFTRFDRDWRIVYVNDAAERMSQRTRLETLGKTLWELFPALVGTKIETEYRRCVAEQMAVELDYHYPLWDQWFRLKCYPTPEEGLVVFFRDITEPKKAEELLRASEEFNRSLMDGSADCVKVMDTDGRLLHINAPGLCQMEVDDFGPLCGQKWAVLWPAEVREEVERALSTARGGRNYSFQAFCPTLKESPRWWDVVVSPVQNSPDGPVVRLLSVSRDITDRKQAEDELSRLAAELSEADRRKDVFLATLAHELRNPLAPIRTGLEVMRLAGTEGKVEQARIMMDRQVSQLVRLVDDLLDVSRITQGKVELRKERVELRAVIDAAVETSRPAIEQAGHDLAVVVPAEPIFVDGDAMRLSQVVCNLLNNSAKYTHRGGHIRLTARYEGGTVVVSVKDDGIGIPPAMMDKVFVMFTQVDRVLEKATGGLGIGLSLVKGLVEMHGGTIAASSDGEGKGSEFVVRLPVGMPVIAQPNRSYGQTSDAVPSALRRILVVDDNEDAADMLSEMLQMMGNQVRTANDGEAGVGVAAQFRPDVVLMDIGMPKVDGHEAARRIRQHPWGRGMVLIALTGWGQKDDRKKSSDAGFDHHLVKPVDMEVLRRLLAGLRTATAE